MEKVKQHPKMPGKKRNLTLIDVIKHERANFNTRLVSLCESLSELKDYDLGMLRYREIPKDPLEDYDVIEVADPPPDCCDTKEGKKEPEVTVDINFAAGSFSVDLKADHACGIFGYSLNASVYKYVGGAVGYSSLGPIPILTETGLKGKLERTWSRRLPPIDSHYKIEISGSVLSHCGTIKHFSKIVVGPL